MKSNSRKFSLLVFPDFSRSILIGNLSLFAISLPCLAVLLSPPPLFLKQKQRRPAHSRKTNAAVRPLQHEDNSSDEEYLYTVSNDNDKSSKRSPVVNVVVEGILTGFFQKIHISAINEGPAVRTDFSEASSLCEASSFNLEYYNLEFKHVTRTYDSIAPRQFFSCVLQHNETTLSDVIN